MHTCSLQPVLQQDALHLQPSPPHTYSHLQPGPQPVLQQDALHQSVMLPGGRLKPAREARVEVRGAPSFSPGVASNLTGKGGSAGTSPEGQCLVLLC